MKPSALKKIERKRVEEKWNENSTSIWNEEWSVAWKLCNDHIKIK